MKSPKSEHASPVSPEHLFNLLVQQAKHVACFKPPTTPTQKMPLLLSGREDPTGKMKGEDTNQKTRSTKQEERKGSSARKPNLNWRFSAVPTYAP
jgi:hypothetical protein